MFTYKMLLSSRKTFISRELRVMSLIAITACVMDYIGPLVSTVFMGGRFGETGLVVSGVVSPINTGIIFCCDFLVASGVYLKGVAASSSDNEKGAKLVGSGLTLSLIIGILLGIFLFFGNSVYLSFFDLSDETLSYAKEYLRIYSIMPLLSILDYYIYEEIFRMGKSRVALAMNIISCVSIVLFSVAGLELFGLPGVALANVAMKIASGGVGFAYIIAKKDLDIRITIDKTCLKELLSMGFMYSQMDLYYLIYSTVMYAFIGNRFGESCMAVFTLLDSVTEICNAFYGVPYASENHLCVYLGEDNTDGVKKTIAASIRFQLLVAVITSMLVIIFAGPVAEFFEMENAYYDQTIFALRIYAASFVFYAMLCFYQDYYASIEASAASICLSLTQYIFIGIVLTIILSIFFGEYGIYLGVFLECPLALLATRILIKKVYKTENIYIIDFRQKDICSFDYAFSKDEIMRTRDAVEEELNKRRIPHDTIMRILLSFEENCMLTDERNKIQTYGECTLFFREHCVDMIIRDNGTAFDSTDTDQSVSSLRSYVVASMSMHYKNQHYYVASSNNRVTFFFEY